MLTKLALAFVAIVWIKRTGADWNRTIDDSDRSAIQYSPDDAWIHETNVNDQDYYSGTTSHSSQTGAQATFTFTGSAVYFIAHGEETDIQIRVILDNSASFTISMQKPADRSAQAIIWSQSLLNTTVQHVLILKNMRSTPLNVDAFVVTEPGEPPADYTSTPPNPNATNNQITHVGTSAPPGVIAGATIGGIVVAIVSVALLIYYFRRRRDKKQTPFDLVPRPLPPSRQLSSIQGPTTHTDTRNPIMVSTTTAQNVGSGITPEPQRQDPVNLERGKSFYSGKASSQPLSSSNTLPIASSSAGPTTATFTLPAEEIKEIDVPPPSYALALSSPAIMDEATRQDRADD